MNKLFFISLVALVGVASFSGCRKKKDTIAKITIKDDANAVVEGATVVLYGTPSGPEYQGQVVTVYDTTTTNSAGVAVFNFNEVYQLGQAGVAVLDIHAWTLTQDGTGIVKVEEETTTEETVYVN
ncbi:MAG: hypothetical protein V4638_00450 [Bacteroidota bacterium]